MDTTKKKAGITILCVALIAIIGSGMAFASSSTKIENNNMTQTERELIDFTKNKQVINVDVKTLESGKFVCLGGPYTFEGGDIIQNDITTEGNNGNLTIKFLEDDKKRDGKGPSQNLALIDRRLQNPDHRIKVSQSQAGSYWLVIGNDDSGILSNIKGTIEITAQ